MTMVSDDGSHKNRHRQRKGGRPLPAAPAFGLGPSAQLTAGQERGCVALGLFSISVVLIGNLVL
jgi:hypothetical protein